MSEATVLAYHMDEVRLMALAQICRAMGVRVVKVEETEYQAPIGLLSGNADPMKMASHAKTLLNGGTDAPAVDEEMIVLCSFSEDLFYSLLQELHDMNLLVGLKAVETESNQYWSGAFLQSELKRERAAYQQMQEKKG